MLLAVPRGFAADMPLVDKNAALTFLIPPPPSEKKQLKKSSFLLNTKIQVYLST